MIGARQHRSAGTVLLDVSGKKVLLTHKVYKDGKEARILPKGHVEIGESDEQAAMRETKEETGYYDFRILKHLADDQFEYTNEKGYNIKTVIWYLGQLNSYSKNDLALTLEEQGTVFEQIRVEVGDAVQKATYEGEIIALVYGKNQ